MTNLRVLSLGLGTQSSALALMSAAGALPKLSAAIFADTGGELPETYNYLAYLREQLDAAGIPLLTVTAGNLETALLASESVGPNPTPPAYTVDPAGRHGKVQAYTCSYDFKRRLLLRATKRLCGEPGAWKRADVTQWLGFSTDEVGRCKPTTECRCGHPRQRHSGACERCNCGGFRPWQTNTWPLIDLGMSRQDTIAWFAENGHPTPPRSACWFCPNQRNPRWLELRTEHPDLWERACALDEAIRNGSGFNRRGNTPMRSQQFLHLSRAPLRGATLDGGGADVDLGAAGMDCAAGVCYT